MLSIDMKNRATMSVSVPKDDIEISNFRNYVLKIEGTEITSKNSEDKKLVLSLGRDNVLRVEIIGSGVSPAHDYSYVNALVPKGYELYLERDAAKMIRGVTGKYLYFKNDESKFIAFVIGSSGKEYRIVLGKLSDKDSKLRKVLDALPNQPFYKADLNYKLPPSIVENRQPIKAALDVLEQEGYVKKTGNKMGISEMYVKTSKIPPKYVSLVEDDKITRQEKG